jgi:hypothetical protein
MAVGLVSAVSSATVAVGASLLFCGPAAPWQCLTPRKARVPGSGFESGERSEIGCCGTARQGTGRPGNPITGLHRQVSTP